MKSKWIYLFYLGKRAVAVFTASHYCVALWKQVLVSKCDGVPRVIRVKPNFLINEADVRFEDITESIYHQVTDLPF